MIFPSPWLLLAILPLLTISASQKTLKHKCATGVHIISGHAHLGGPLGPQLGGIVHPPPPQMKRDTGPPEGFGELFPLFVKIRHAIPGTTNYTVPYMSYASPEFPIEVHGSTLAVRKAIEDYVKSCPNTPIVLTGYSEGAMAISNTLCGSTSPTFIPTEPIQAKYGKNIFAAVVYGDESRAADQSYDRGGCKTSAPLPRLNPKGCEPFENRIRSYCDAHDVYCCLGGTSRQAHFIYEAKYSDAAAKFVISKYKDLA